MKLIKEAFTKELEERAKASLHNPSEITAKCIDVATDETLQECKGKDVKSWAAMDFAMIRVKVYLKIGLSDDDELLLKEALKSIQNSPTLEDNNLELGSFGYEVV